MVLKFQKQEKEDSDFRKVDLGRVQRGSGFDQNKMYGILKDHKAQIKNRIVALASPLHRQEH